MKTELENIIEELKLIPEVEIIALGGSRAKCTEDKFSDYDVYVYSSKRIDIEIRKCILDRYTEYMEYSNTYWEEEDDGILNNGKEIELIYRDINFLKEQYEKHYLNYESSFGYTTCHIDNIYTSKVLFDRNNIMYKYKKKFSVYPEKLRKSIVFKNIELLYDKTPSFGYQIIKALKRRDLIAINNRISEYFAVYLDIIFALNNKFNTGEKRLLSEFSTLEILPSNAIINIEKLLAIMMTDFKKAIELVKILSKDLIKLVCFHYPDYKVSNINKYKIRVGTIFAKTKSEKIIGG